MKTKLIIASAILFAASATSAFADSWIGSAVNVNGTWYSTRTLGWGNSEPSLFNNQNLGAISALNLGGLSLVYPETSMNEQTMTMGYKIDGVQQPDITLDFIGYDKNNRKYQSGGNNFTGQSVDISKLSFEGTHTLEVWFVVRTKYNNNDDDYLWDSNGGSNFKATFTRKAPTSIANSSNITVSETPVDVQLNGLTLYKDGKYNTLCLPFNLTRGDFEMTVLNVNNVEIHKLLESSELVGSTLTLNFSGPWTTEHEYDILIEAGKPYIIKWDNVGGTISNPIFTNVKLSTYQASSVAGTGVTFKGTFDQITCSSTNNYLLVGGNNTLCYPEDNAQINPFHAYFELESSTPGASGVKAIVLNFGDDTNSIQTISNETSSNEGYFTLDGRRLNNKPATAGLYIINGKKVVIK